MRGLKIVLLHAEKERMKPDSDLASLRHKELVALVQQLREQLAERDQELARLKRLLVTGTVSAPVDNTPSAAPTEPASGSKEDLLAQLQQIYPAGR